MEKFDFKNIYSNLIAGRLPVGSGSAQRVVMNHAYAILGTQKLHMHYIERAGFVYYFAIESRWLASAPGFRLPFSEVLPGEALHVGDAIYQLTGQDYTAALVVEGMNIKFLCNEPEVLKDYLIDLDLRIIDLQHNGGSALLSIPQTLHGISERFNAIFMKSSLAVLVVSSCVFLLSSIFNIYSKAQNQPDLSVRAVQNDLNATLEKLSIQQPLARQIARVQKVSATVIRSGGWIESYSLKGESEEQFELVLPSWVSQDYLDSLGRDVITDLRDMEGLLVVRKISKGGKS
ncbi:MAG TPA: hypothetical protein VFV43_10325 [Limnobacter sp.]|nr:hypothetical protein [Limnobacter sp.]